LHGSYIAVFYSQGNGLYGFSLQRTKLPGHILKKMLSGFTALKTVMELFMESFELIYKAFNISFAKIALGYRVKVLVASGNG